MTVTFQNALRLALYWGIVATAYWTLAYVYGNGPLKGSIWYSQKFAPQFVAGLHHPISGFDAGVLIGLVAPTLLVSSLSILFLTNAPLPSWRTSWINKLFAAIRTFRRASIGGERSNIIIKKNQFGIGETSFNYLAMFAILVPVMFEFVTSTVETIKQSTEVLDAASIVYNVALSAGYAGALALTFFLIPVTRHSVLLAAMGWSPLQALRMHVWAGYIAFFFIMAHSILFVVDWFVFETMPVRDQVLPARRCWSWTWKPDLSGYYDPSNPDWACDGAWINLTGVLASVFFIILVVTSFNWVRRHFYRIFYICHVVFGAAMILMAIAHRSWLAYLWLPSIAYYLASTTPTLVQALASRFRGGVRIVKVIPMANTGGCVEVRVAVNLESLAAIESESSLFVKLCVPKISLIWHPFSVYKHPHDPSTARFLIRPIGPFTRKLVELLTAPNRPVTLLDGFYRKGDHAVNALQHDNVTIVAGGAAITAFLTMIPNLLNKLVVSSRGENCPAPKTIDLHWICREPYLIQFIQETYFEDILEMARKITSVRKLHFTILVHYTGVAEPVFAERIENSASTETDSDDDEEKSSRDYHIQKQVSGEAVVSERVDSECQEKPLESEIKGFEMEPARLMAGRYSEVLQNIPLFAGLSFGLWIGLWIIFHWYNKGNYTQYKVNLIIAGVWGPVITILVLIAFSLVLETSALLLHKCWPAPKGDSFDIGEYLSKNDSMEVVETDSSCVRMILLRGRPSAEDLLAGASLASAPGIFLCGPVALTDFVKKEAGKENSLFGLTRFCLYDEPSEL